MGRTSLRLSFVLLWALLGPVGAQLKPGHLLRKVEIVGFPPDALVSRLPSGAQPGSKEPLGRADGSTLEFQLPASQTTVTLQLEHPECENRVVTLDLQAAARSRSIRFPLDGTSYELDFRGGWLARIWYRLRHAVWLVALLLLGVGALGAAAARARQRARQAAAESERLEALAQRVVSDPEVDDPLIGRQVGDYRLLQLLGRGGMARVYRAVPELDPDAPAVALKVMNPEQSDDLEMVRRFDREKRVYETLRHPHIVQMLAAGSFGRNYFLVMELVTGSTLGRFLPAEGLPPRQALKLLRPVFEAVAFAHSRGIAHRDLKPDNIMVSEQGVVKVMDFGLARSHGLTQVTATGSVLGTPAYMAPEQINGSFEPSVDQYALGIVTFQLLTGRLPFQDVDPVAVLMAHLSRPAPRLSELKPGLEKLDPAVARMLAKDPAERFRDLNQALVQLSYLA